MPMENPPSSAFTVTVLGSGTSTGVPVIGCDCAVCRSSNPRNKRLRPSIAITIPNNDTISAEQPVKSHTLLIDTTPDMRQQVLRAGIERVDSVLITHAHADHIFGMDDLRQFNFRQGIRIPVYGTDDILQHLRVVFAYCFQETQGGGGKPQLDLKPIFWKKPFTIAGMTVTPLPVLHGQLFVTAFKFGETFAYVTDVSEIPPITLQQLYGLDTLILDTVRHEPHPTHFHLARALDVIAELKPRQTYLTHLSHHFDYDETMRNLPSAVALAYDGLQFPVEIRQPEEEANQ